MNTENQGTRLNADSVNSLDDMKTCMRQNEAINNHKFDVIDTEISFIRTEIDGSKDGKVKGIKDEIKTNRYINLVTLFIASSALIIVIALSIGVQIIERYLK